MKFNKNISNIIYWSLKNLKGEGQIKDRLDFLLDSQYWSPAKLEEYQLQKVQSLLSHAYNTVPYYRRTMDEYSFRVSNFGSMSDLRRLPLLTREKLHKHQNDLLSSKADFATLKTNFSSGSTGIRACFQQDSNFRMWMRAHQLRTYMWCSNWQLGDPFVLLWGSEIYWSNKTLYDKFENLLTNRREFNTFRLSQDLVANFLRNLSSFKPALISTYSNAMHLIALEAEKRGLKIEGLRAIQGTSEPMPDAFRQRIMRVMDCEVFDKYGSRETNIVCHESPRHEQMCIQSENVFVEFLNDQNEPCTYGEKGRLVLTTLNNLSMPLIRYETTDLAAPVADYCSSGIGLSRMTAVTGRIQDLILTPSGDHIDAYFFSYLFMRFNHIHWFQVEQQVLDRLIIRLLVPSGITDESLKEINERIIAHTGYDFKPQFEILKEMPHSPTGKFRLCISNLTEHYFRNEH